MEENEKREASVFVIPLIQFFMGCFLFAALLHTQKVLFVTIVLILGLMTIAKVWSRLGSSAVTCLSTVDKDRLFPGEQITLECRAENVKFLPVWLQVGIDSAAGMVFLPESIPPVRQSGLLGYQGVRFKWMMTALKRGVYQVGPPYLRTGDFFGFFLKERKDAGTLDVIVYPRLIPLRPLSLPRQDFFGVPGTESPVRDPAYILGTRDYQHNQSARHIHWKASARHNRLQEKIFEPTVQEKVLLVLDVDQFATEEAGDEFERTLEVMASLAVQLDQKGYPLGLATNGVLTGGGPSLLPVAGGPLHLSAILEILARVRMTRSDALINLLQKGMQLSWGISCVHFSCQLDASTRMAENYFSIRRTLPRFVICRNPSNELRDEHSIQNRIYCLDELRIEGMEES